MKAEELRIGNIVSRKFFNPNPKNPAYEYENCIVKGIGLVKVNITTGLNRNEILKLDYEFLKPVELTEEWLLKFGFKKIEEDFYSIKTKKQYVALEVSIKEKRTILYKKSGGFSDVLFTKHVHLLQNLYQSICEIELTIK